MLHQAVALGSAVAELCRRAMGPPLEKPGYQIVIHECDQCGKAARDSTSGPIEVPRAELEAARADAEVLDLRAGGKGERRRTITPAERRAVIARDHGCCAICGTRAWLHVHHLERKAGDVAVLSLLCSACHKSLVHAGHVTLGGRGGDLTVHRRDGTALRSRSGP